MLKAILRRTTLGGVLLTHLLCLPQAHAQGKTFDVVSIRQNISQQRRGQINLAADPDGFHAEAQPLMDLPAGRTSHDGSTTWRDCS